MVEHDLTSISPCYLKPVSMLRVGVTLEVTHLVLEAVEQVITWGLPHEKDDSPDRMSLASAA